MFLACRNRGIRAGGRRLNSQGDQPMPATRPAATVHRIHFDDLSSVNFERLVFAFLLRTNDWLSLDWYGQAGGDSGRDIWGVRENDLFPSGQKLCALCANW